MDDKDLAIERLKQIIYNQKLATYMGSISKNDCPWQHGYVENKEEIDCDAVGCSTCRDKFWEALKLKVKEEVDKL